MADLPTPLTPSNCDLRSLDWFKLNYKQLRRSTFWLNASDAAARVSVDLWCEAFEQVPAASLPDDDTALAEAAGFGRRNIAAWLEVREEVLSAWTLCSDGRWYHKTLAGVANEAFAARLKERARKKVKKGEELVYPAYALEAQEQLLRDYPDHCQDVPWKCRAPEEERREEGAEPPRSSEEPPRSSAGTPRLEGEGEGEGESNTDREVLSSPLPDADAIRLLASEPVPSFEAFWERYPKRLTETGKLVKNGKQEAKSRWQGLAPATKHAAFLGLPRYAEGAGDKPKDAVRYLRHRLWENETEPAPPRPPGPGRTTEHPNYTRTRDAIEELAREQGLTKHGNADRGTGAISGEPHDGGGAAGERAGPQGSGQGGAEVVALHRHGAR